MKDGAVQLGDIAAKIAMLEVACRRCERRGRLADAHETITDLHRRLDIATEQLGGGGGGGVAAKIRAKELQPIKPAMIAPK
jgi:hypothetical protein